MKTLCIEKERLHKTGENPTSIISGIITGQIAGLIMAVVVMLVFAVFLHKGPLYPVQVIGSMVLGERALGGFEPMAILCGLILHQLGPSLLWGTLYGFAAAKLKIRNVSLALICGLVLGVISMVGPYLLIPFLMNSFHGVDIWGREVPMFWDWAAHIVFGACFAIYPVIFKKMIAILNHAN